jgi:hypothetical protein
LKGTIQNGDSILFYGSIASQSIRNTIQFGIDRRSEQTFEYAGPDSGFVFRQEIQKEGKILESVTGRCMIPSGILPGDYICFGRVQELGGTLSDSVKYSLFIHNPAYPEMVLDTPFNGISANHRIDSTDWLSDKKEFRLQIRSFADRMAGIEIQWFDSLKSASVQSAMIQNVGSVSGLASLNRLLSFPDIKGRKFYLRTVAVTLDNRSLTTWIPFERNFAYP